jgi:hypothetical protein
VKDARHRNLKSGPDCNQAVANGHRWRTLAPHANALRRDGTVAFAAEMPVHHVVWGSYFGANQLLFAHGRRPWSRYDATRHPRNPGYVPFAGGMRKRLVSIPNPVVAIPQSACSSAYQFQSITRRRLLGQGVLPVRGRR